MAEKVVLTVEIAGDKYKGTLTFESSVLPEKVFYYRNTGENTLGEFIGVVDLQQLTSYPAWTGVPLPTFSVPFVRHSSAVDFFDEKSDLATWSSVLKKDLSALKIAVASNPTEVTEYPLP